MARLTYKNPDGTFGLNNGYDMHKVPTELMGAIWKLKDYEETGLEPERVEEVNDFFNSQTAKILAELQEYKSLGLTLEQLKEIDKLYLEKCQEVNRLSKEHNDWIPAEKWLPNSDNYILLSFANFSIPMVGRYETDENGGAFYIGDENETCVSQGVFVNAWQPLPEPYQPKGEQDE